MDHCSARNRTFTNYHYLTLSDRNGNGPQISRPDRNDVLEDWSVVAAFLSQATNSLFDFGRSSLAANTTQR